MTVKRTRMLPMIKFKAKFKFLLQFCGVFRFGFVFVFVVLHLAQSNPIGAPVGLFTNPTAGNRV